MAAESEIISLARSAGRNAPQWRFAWWQRRARFDRHYGFHATRHSAVTAVYRATGNLFLAQRLARHASPITTIIRAHSSDEELAEGVRDLRCWRCCRSAAQSRICGHLHETGRATGLRFERFFRQDASTNLLFGGIVQRCSAVTRLGSSCDA